MRRAAALALSLAILPHPVMAQTDDWRPARADGLAVLDAAMAPILSAFQPSLDAVLQDIANATLPVMLTSPPAMVTAMEARMAAVQALPIDIAALRDLAASAIGTLRAHQPEACWAEYHSVQTVGWLLVGDSTQSLIAGDMAEANSQLGAGAYLLKSYSELVHGAAVADCAA